MRASDLVEIVEAVMDPEEGLVPLLGHAVEALFFYGLAWLLSWLASELTGFFFGEAAAVSRGASWVRSVLASRLVFAVAVVMLTIALFSLA